MSKSLTILSLISVLEHNPIVCHGLYRTSAPPNCKCQTWFPFSEIVLHALQGNFDKSLHLHFFNNNL